MKLKNDQFVLIFVLLPQGPKDASFAKISSRIL